MLFFTVWVISRYGLVGCDLLIVCRLTEYFLKNQGRIGLKVPVQCIGQHDVTTSLNALLSSNLRQLRGKVCSKIQSDNHNESNDYVPSSFRFVLSFLERISKIRKSPDCLIFLILPLLPFIVFYGCDVTNLTFQSGVC